MLKKIAFLLLISVFLLGTARAAELTLTWDAPATLPPGYTLTGYVVQGCLIITPAGCVPTDLPQGTASPTTLSWTDRAVIVGRTYTYAVVAVYSPPAGQRSLPSAVLVVTIPAPLTYPTPGAMAVAALPAVPGPPITTPVRLTWTAPVFAAGDVLPGTLTGYKLWRDTPTWRALLTVGPTVLTWDDLAAPVGRSCYLAQAVYTTGESLNSVGSCVTTVIPPEVLPPGVTNLRVSVP